jgi:hypothetical protein
MVNIAGVTGFLQRLYNAVNLSAIKEAIIEHPLPAISILVPAEFEVD